MSDKKISQAVINRLPRYYRYLSELDAAGVERISSSELSEKMHTTASQIRQDLNNFGGFGQQGYGYQVASLKEEIGRILGLDLSPSVIIIGAGNLGQALAHYPGFAKRGFRVVGIFDKAPDKIGSQAGDMTIKPMDELGSFVKNNSVDIAALTLPRGAAEEIVGNLYAMGIRAFWNFTSADIREICGSGAVVENVHLAESLMRLSYAITKYDEGDADTN